MKTIEFYLTLPSGQQLLDVIEWEDGERDEVYTEGAIEKYLLHTGRMKTYFSYLESVRVTEDFINLLEVLALPRNEEDEVVSKVIIQL